MNLRELRKQSGKTVTEVANKLGVTPSAVRHYESGARQINLLQIKPLAELLGVSVDEIIDCALNIGKPD